ncbi:hypothetical protein [Methylobacterium iners]|uniref:Recombinase zinc beta ribbon domain-containing protein n=1 Tax=Methylobacterium iners TaxID=418707 RepID=A0ABQ4RT46_9HYPH|nr:hypothetical protein [Methylobacterium iners]GJD92879.1 hypothetical protein OCOJLMKI_0062 [Methylobacterium iners]
MNGAACQVCGRRIALKMDGKVRLHHQRGLVCAGSDHVQLKDGTDAIVAAIAAANLTARSLRATVADHAARRLNWPLPPSIDQGIRDAEREAFRLERRLKSWRTRDERRARHFERYGWTW